MRGLLVRPDASPEHFTDLLKLFDEINNAVISCLQNGMDGAKLFSSHMESLRLIRKECFSLYLQGLQSGCAVVNLPQFGKIYADRVTEGLDACLILDEGLHYLQGLSLPAGTFRHCASAMAQ